MLTLGPGSTCDICLDPFGAGIKAASAIVCGHVFCCGCIENLRAALPTSTHPDRNYKPCPLCRHTFDTRQYSRLHIDLDNSNVAPRASPVAPPRPTVNERESKTLLTQIFAIADGGASEEESRLTISDTRAFFELQRDTHTFPELRTCYRMLMYLTDTQSKHRVLRTQHAELQARVTGLEVQVVDFEAKVADLDVKLREAVAAKTEVERKAKDEKEMALSIETSFREHARQTHDAYLSIIQHYNVVAGDVKTITQHLQRQAEIDSHPSDSHSRHSYRQSTRELASSISQRLTSYHDEHARHEHVMTDVENLVISPLSCLSTLPAQRSIALPEESDSEVPLPVPQPRFQPSSCHNRDHPADCTCAVPHPETPRATPQSSVTRHRSATVQERPTAVPDYVVPLTIMPTPQHGREDGSHGTEDYEVDYRASSHASRSVRTRDRSSSDLVQTSSTPYTTHIENNERSATWPSAPLATQHGREDGFYGIEDYDVEHRSSSHASRSTRDRDRGSSDLVQTTSSAHTDHIEHSERSVVKHDHPAPITQPQHDGPHGIEDYDVDHRSLSHATRSSRTRTRDRSSSDLVQTTASPYNTYIESTQPSSLQPSSSFADERTVATAPMPIPSTNHSINNRTLQDLLQDSTPPNASSSRSAAAQSTSSTPRRHSHSTVEKSTATIGYYALPHPSPAMLAASRASRDAPRQAELHDTPQQSSPRSSKDKDNEPFLPPLDPAPSRPAAPYQPVYVPVPGPLPYDPTHITSASSAAKAKERERAEKAEKVDKAEREKRDEKDARKAEREERRRAKHAAEAEMTASFAGSSSSMSKRPSDYNHLADRPQHVSSSSSSRHASSRDLGPPPAYTPTSQYLAGSSRHTDKYRTDPHGSRYVPVQRFSARA